MGSMICAEGYMTDLVIEIYMSDDDSFIAVCPQLELFSRGISKEEAVGKLKARINSHFLSAERMLGPDALKHITHHYHSRREQMH